MALVLSGGHVPQIHVILVVVGLLQRLQMDLLAARQWRLHPSL